MAITYLGMDLAPANNQLAVYLKFIIDEEATYSYKVLGRSTSTTSLDFTYSSSDIITLPEIKVPVIGLYANLSLIHISEPTRLHKVSRMPSSA